ncbi:MAG: Fic family protein [Solirubrobacteraceae bacterium]
MSGATSELVVRAERAVADLNHRDPAPASLEGLARQLMRSEALASSQIEGLAVSHRKLAQASIEGLGHHRAMAVLGNMHAMEKAIEIGTSADPITRQDIADIHAAIAIVPPLDRIAGKYREEQGWIGGDSPIHAEFVPSPALELTRLVEDLCEFLARDDLPAVAQAAIAHAQFETIHPFGDGNGRVGRCLIHVTLRRRGLAPNYVPPISLLLGANKDAYIAGLESFRRDDVEPWLAQFARVTESSALQAEHFSDAINRLQEAWIEAASPMRADSAARVVIANLPAFPYITVKIVEHLTGRSNVTALNALARLTEASILTRHPNRGKGDSWEAKELFMLLDEFEGAVKDVQAER